MKATMTQVGHKPALSAGQIWNMSFGFLGIQIGFALQNGTVSRIFQTLGASIDDVPLLWIAGPVTGLLIQPVIGYFSDRTWGPLGRRRPYFLVGAILTTKSPVSLNDVTPIARLTGEYEAIVVPANSEIQNIGQLVEKLKADPGSVSWAGGSAGGTDHIGAGLIAKAAGVDPTKINYIAYSGGGEALAAILGGQVTVGISSYGEFQAQVAADTLRLLAVSSAERIEGADAPTLTESGLDVVLQNWRMVAAAPGLTDEQKAAVTADVEKLAKSAGWQETLKTKNWQDTYLVGAAFEEQLAKDIAATEAILKDIGLVK